MIRIEYFVERLRPRVAWWPMGLGGVLVFATAWLVQEGDFRLAIAGALVALLGGLALIRPRAAIVVTFVFLAVLGDFRRALIPLTGWSSQDPLLLVGPAVAVLLILLIIGGRRLRLDTPLSRWILGLMLLMLLQIVNPLQGGLDVGIAGVVFYMVPLIWFWIGRFYATPSFVVFLLYRVVVPLATLAALLGLYQTFFGFLSFEQDWINIGGYGALFIEFGKVRPFSFFASAAEYVHVVGVALVALWASWLRGARVGLVLIPFLALALFLGGIRGIIVTGLITVALLWAVQTRSPSAWVPRLVLGLALTVAGVAWGLPLVQQSDTGLAEVVVTHQVSGLLKPQESTLSLHIDQLLSGFAGSVANPLGMGLGAATAATRKFSGTGGISGTHLGSTEVDLSNTFVSLGVVGGLVYAGIIVLVLLTAFRYWYSSRTLVALAILGMLIVEIGQWLMGGYYMVSALIWFYIGALDKFQSLRRSTVADSSRDAQGDPRGRPGTHKLRDSAGSPSRRASGSLGSQRGRS